MKNKSPRPCPYIKPRSKLVAIRLPGPTQVSIDGAACLVYCFPSWQISDSTRIRKFLQVLMKCGLLGFWGNPPARKGEPQVAVISCHESSHLVVSTSARYPELRWTQKQKYKHSNTLQRFVDPQLWVKDQTVLQAPPFPVRVMMMMMETGNPRESCGLLHNLRFLS